MTNKDIAINFLQFSSSGQVAEAFQRFVGSDFVHHNPYFEGNAESLIKGMIENTKNNPDKILEIKTAILEDNLVALHSCVKFPKMGRIISAVHIFRFNRDKIVELWDIGQQVTENNLNINGMF